MSKSQKDKPSGPNKVRVCILGVLRPKKLIGNRDKVARSEPSEVVSGGGPRWP